VSTDMLDIPPRTGGPSSRRRWWWVAAVVAVLAVAGAAVAVALTRSDGGGSAAPTATASAQPSAQPSGQPSSGQPSTSPSGTQAPAPSFRYLTLWPFGSSAEAVAWQSEAGEGGHQPWRLDASLTALTFTRQYLGFSTVDRVVSRSSAGDEAWIGVGSRAPDGSTVPAAVVHLARIGGGSLTERPWEVVGTRDTTLTLSTPAYGAAVRSPVTVGGRITGVDESLILQVRSLRASGPLGAMNGIPAGGQNAPWSVSVPFVEQPAGTVLTIVVATGGHASSGIERFAITGVRMAG
jgi:hypothetical protein